MKKKWYRLPGIKLVLVLAAQISAVGLALCLLLFLAISSVISSGNVFEKLEEHYEDTSSFAKQMGTDASEALSYLSVKSQFETEGQFDPDKIVDIIVYDEEGVVSGSNVYGLAYRVEDLEEWSRQYCMQGGGGYQERGIVVCKKSDGTYAYFYMEDFRKKVTEGELNLYMGESAIPKHHMLEKEFFRELENGEFERDLFPKLMPAYSWNTAEEQEESEKLLSAGRLNLRDAEGNLLYVDCWVLDRTVQELFPPVGADSLLEAVENSPQLNGKLSDTGTQVASVLGKFYDDVSNYKWQEENKEGGNSNFSYIFLDHAKKQAYSNIVSCSDYVRAKDYISGIEKKENCKYMVINPKQKDCSGNVELVSVKNWIRMAERNQIITEDYTFAAMVDTSYPAPEDKYAVAVREYETWRPYYALCGGLLIALALIFLTALLWLTLIAGRRAEDEDLHLHPFDNWKTEIAAGSVISLWILVMMLSVVVISYTNISLLKFNNRGEVDTASLVLQSQLSLYWGDFIIIGTSVLFTVSLFLIGYLSLVRRIKAGTVWSNSLLKMMGSGVHELSKTFWENRGLTAKAVLATSGLILLHWVLAMVMTVEHAADMKIIVGIFVAAVDFVTLYLVAKNYIGRQRIKDGLSAIASGDSDYKIDVEELIGAEREVAEEINHIGDGMQQAVASAIKSERLKTDLITNVSHDIKTPLTSIINYVDLLKRENFEDPRVRGYLDVLDAKSQRLKTLTEDVVEASKVSSGNISLEYMNVNLVEMINQTIGETSEKMEKRNLEVIATLPDEPVIIRVDGRRMWRVLENIFNNAAKYAMPGTRIYADLQKINGQALFSLKNVSEQPLNINADELTERFIRGDVARSTEGSGLGLSIAKSLTTLQGGTFDLYLDGDLFKVIIVFDEQSRKEES